MTTQPSSLGEELIDHLKPHFANSHLRHLHTTPAQPAQYQPWPMWAHPPLVEYFQEHGIHQPWSHQAATAEAIHNHQDTIVATSTASGKTLGYQLPILTALADPTATVASIYISPTKALAQDQRARLTKLTHSIPTLNHIMVATYDADTPTEQRRTIREHAHIIITNPDMLHASILNNPNQWTRVLSSLRYLIIDESHTYRGVFGAHVAMVLRRLLRLTRQHVTVICASATSADPASHARLLTGRDCLAITDDGSPTGQTTYALWEPGFLDPDMPAVPDAPNMPNAPAAPGASPLREAPVRRAATTESADLMAHIIAQGARTLTFVRSRRAAEFVALGAAETLSSLGRSQDAVRVAAYRAGYTPEDRRELERKLDEGELLGVASTNALELGIDVGGLDAVICAGFPGTIASFRQQAGRAGRRGQGALVTLVASDNPMDLYLVNHPAALLERGVERTVFNPANPYVMADHLVCAAAERPLQAAEIAAWGAERVVAFLEDRRLLRARTLRGEKRWHADLRAADTIRGEIAIRGGAGKQVAIVVRETGLLLGTVDAARAISDVHTGAVYLHQGETYLVEALVLEEHVAWVREALPEYSTRVHRSTDIRVRRTRHSEQLADGVWVADVDVDVIHHVKAYEKRLPSGEVIDTVPMDVAPEQLRTRAVAYTVEPWVLQELGIAEPLWPGTLHAAEHAAIGLLPLVATCDRWDIGGVSTVLHADTGLPTVFVYDGYQGGAGFAEAGFQDFSRWMDMTLATLRSCGCESGCPSCVQSPKCGNDNDPLSKEGALRLLEYLAEVAGGHTGSQAGGHAG